METPVITYSLKDRGRKYRGKDRNFNIPDIVGSIRSRACQERVKHRDMLGYYGHWARVRFGMNPAEGGLDGGKAVSIEPAIVTTELSVTDDGVVSHKAEFLPTQAGQIAQKLFEARIGGFSSAIDTLKPEFYGFDYVLEPNFSTNRGYTLDSVMCEGGACSLGMTLDDVDAAIYDEQLAGLGVLLDSSSMVHSAALLAMESLKAELAGARAENAELLLQLARLKRTKKAINSGMVALDDIAISGKSPDMIDRGATDRMLRNAREFMGANLIGFEDPDKGNGYDMPDIYDKFMSRYRYV